MSGFYTVNEVGQKSYFLKKALVMDMICIFFGNKRLYFGENFEM